MEQCLQVDLGRYVQSQRYHKAGNIACHRWNSKPPALPVLYRSDEESEYFATFPN